MKVNTPLLEKQLLGKNSRNKLSIYLFQMLQPFKILFCK